MVLLLFIFCISETQGNDLIPTEKPTLDNTLSNDSLKKLGIALLLEKKYTLADSAFLSCINASKREHDPINQGKCISNLASSLLNQQRYGEALPLYLQAIDIYQKHNQDTLYAQTLINIALAYKKIDLYDSAMVNLHKGIKILERLKSKPDLMNGYNILATTLRNSGSNSPLAYFQKSLTIAHELDDKQHVAKVYNNIGNYYHDEEASDSAIFYYKKSLALKPKGSRQATTLLNLGLSYMALQKYDSARHYLNLSYSLRNTNGSSVSIFKYYIELIRLNTLSGDNDSTDFYISQADSILSSVSVPLNLVYDFNDVKYKAFSAQGQSQKALELAELLIALKDSLISEQKQQLISRYEVAFSVNEWKKAFELEALQRKQDKTTYRWIATFILITLFCMLLYAWFRSREAKKAKIQFKELNHRTNNLLSIFSSLIILQEMKLTTTAELNAFKKIKSQVDILNSVYRLLANPTQSNSKWIAFDNYILHICESLCLAVGLKVDDYTIINNMQQVNIHEKQCNPLALIVNEVITNAIKYGKNDQGHLTLEFMLSEINNEITLEIKDQGNGFSNDTERKGEGSEIIKLLGKQLRADYSYGENGSSDFKIKFIKKGLSQE
ncbi:tetratricopeptide repeat protein [Fulvivirga maritima]|uniref:tetratricopeptide repeat protein n=1 Tax=Fulvivirga maritima TaxID=2904247 RepID=UPI001F1CAC85|nr:tetratricopeptide repeat protein [Fulvivirga maritima]UII25128.1 tetratricopeptide repeat protein [Fulvivirga maritima]